MGKFIDIKGQKFNKLTAIEYLGKSKWLFKCDCGREIITNSFDVRIGKTKSCGCNKKEFMKNIGIKNTKHGLTDSRIYHIWRGIKLRCYNIKSKDYKNYGGRGIKVCEEWKNSFENFQDWSMNNGYSDNLTIDRINNNGNYEPNNCRWANTEQQANNKRNCVYIKIDGETKTSSQWERELGISRKTVKKYFSERK